MSSIYLIQKPFGGHDQRYQSLIFSPGETTEEYVLNATGHSAKILLKDKKIFPVQEQGDKHFNLVDLHKWETGVERFLNKKIHKIDTYLQNVQEFWHSQPFFYDEKQCFWFWQHTEYKWVIVDEIDIMNKLDDLLGFEGQTIDSKIKNSYLEAFKRWGRKKKPLPSKKNWIQFRNKAFSLTKGLVYDVTPKYFFTNPIPWKLGETSDTPHFDRLFEEWVGEYRTDLYEVLAYCCYQGYPISVLTCLFGGGSNGKTTFLRILERFVGIENTGRIDFDKLTGKNTNRFELIRIWKKLVCLMSETNHDIMHSSQMIKEMVGDNVQLSYEMKNKPPFQDYNYAKIVIASNSLPTMEDTTDGNYRRWNIIPFPHQFPEGKDILADVPDSEYEALCRKVCEILPGLLEKGSFAHQGSIVQRREAYVMASNPLPLFLDMVLVKDHEGYIRYSELYILYTQWLQSTNRRVVSKREFSQKLEHEGYEIRKTNKKIGDQFQLDRWIEGYQYRKNMQIVPIVPVVPTLVPQFSYGEKRYQTQNNGHNWNNWDEKALVWQPCAYPNHHNPDNKCGDVPCNLDMEGKPLCRMHLEASKVSFQAKIVEEKVEG